MRPAESSMPSLPYWQVLADVIDELSCTHRVVPTKRNSPLDVAGEA